MNKPKSILVVEDDDDIRPQLVQILEDEGYAATSTVNGRKALDELAGMDPENFPACILLDLMMPVMNGLEFYNELRKQRRYDGIQVILATAKGTVGGEIHGVPKELPRITKPMDIDQLVRAIENLIGKP